MKGQLKKMFKDFGLMAIREEEIERMEERWKALERCLENDKDVFLTVAGKKSEIACGLDMALWTMMELEDLPIERLRRFPLPKKEAGK